VGTNNEANFRAAVSCTTFDATGAVSEAMIITPAFPATETGNANIMTTVTLPDPCLAPMVMILAGADDHWLAVMGSGEPEEPGP
jgi:hypothetical protein